MTVTLDSFYAREADRIARGPQNYGGNKALASLRAFRRYHGDAHVDVIDAAGAYRWVTAKQSRIYAVLMRDAGKPGLKMREIAKETMTCPSTVSRTIVKLQAWGLIAVDIVRGRNGGIYVIRERIDSYVARARVRLREMAQKVRDRARALNVASYYRPKEKEYEEGKKALSKVLVDMDATFSAFMVAREESGGRLEPASPVRTGEIGRERP